MIDIKKLSILSIIESCDQTGYEFVDQSNCHFKIKRLFSIPLNHVFHIPVIQTIIYNHVLTAFYPSFPFSKCKYPVEIPKWQFINDKSCLKKPVNLFPTTDKTLTRLFLRIVFHDYVENKRPFPERFKALDPVFCLKYKF